MTQIIKFMIGIAAVVVIIGTIDMIAQLFIKRTNYEKEEAQENQKS